jgi:hypothetical protein
MASELARTAASLLIVSSIVATVGTRPAHRSEAAHANGKRDASRPPLRHQSFRNKGARPAPEKLPGRLRLTAGQAIVRLLSGVELAVLGPCDLEIRTAMTVNLKEGRLLANVPHGASGFTVTTEDLEVYDLGTIFSVAVRPIDVPQPGKHITDVFVFKGSVQVNEAGHNSDGTSVSGEGIGVCEAGEGCTGGQRRTHDQSRRGLGKHPAAVRRVSKDEERRHTPNRRLRWRKRIADLWVERYMPEEASVLAAKRLVTARQKSHAPFRKTAWVRPSAPAASTAGTKNSSSEQEAETMTTTRAATAAAATVLLLGTGSSGASSAPILVDTSPHHNRHWETVFTNQVPLQWTWNTNASYAELQIAGMNTTFITNFTESPQIISGRPSPRPSRRPKTPIACG